MANLSGIFNNDDTQNWFAACLATKCCREGLLDLIATVGQCLQKQVIQNAIQSKHLPLGTVCVNCPTSVLRVIRCHTSGVCKRDVTGRCKFHTTPPRPCPNNLCDAMVREITSYHRFGGPSWRNTNADKWTNNPFEILKCYMPPDGYIDKRSAADTDFNGLINVAINCKLFEKYFSSDLKQAINVCTEARAATRDLRHNAGFKLDRVKLHNVYDALLALLNDPRFLFNDQKANDAVKKISELKAGKLTVTAVDINAVLEDMKDCRAEVIKQMTEAAAKAITHVTDDKVKEAEEKISQTTDMKVKQAEGKISDTTDEKVKEAERDISSHTEQCLTNAQTDEGIKTLEAIKEEKAAAGKELEESTRKRSLDKFSRLKKEYRGNLIPYYKKEKCVVPLAPVKAQFDEELSKIYAQPNVSYHTKKAEGVQGHNQGAPVTKYKDIFYKDGKEMKNIYILGEAGMGKSTFCQHLTSLWCHVMRESDNNPAECSDDRREANRDILFSDIEIFQQFDFVFPVILRKAKENPDLDTLIDQQVIKYVRRNEKHDDEFIRRIMNEEKCLVVIDGLDEWPHSIPERVFRENWTYITTTRPWKMADIQLPDSKIDVELSITGITDSKDFLERAFLSLNEKHSQKTGTHVDKEPKKFIKAIRENNLDKFQKVPIVLMQLISLWFSTEKLGRSGCEIYAGAIEMMMKRTKTDKPNCLSELGSNDIEIKLPKCFPQSKPQLCINNKSFILNLAKLAFYTLTQDDQSSSVVFDAEVVDQYLSDTERRVALDIGIVSECEVVSMHDDKSTFNFLHKTFQEFLCAVFIATRNSDDRNHCMTALFGTFGKRVSIFDVSEIFTFVCGMNPDAGVDMSQTIGENMTKVIVKSPPDLYSHIETYQTLIEKGFSECVNNGHERPPLYYQHVYIAGDDQQNSIHKHLLDMNAGRLLSLKTKDLSVGEVMEVVYRNSNLTYIQLHNIDKKHPKNTLDMSSCTKLEHLLCDELNEIVHININPSRLISCNLRSMPESAVKDVLTALASGAPRLQTLTVDSCGCPDLLLQLLPTLTGQEEMWLFNVDIGDSELHFPPSARQVKLRKIRSSSGVIDMSACDRLEELECKNVTVRHMYINQSNLTSCTLENMSESSVKDVLTALVSGAPRLQTLTVDSCGCPDILLQLLPTLTCLKKVWLVNVDIGDSEVHFPPSVRGVKLRNIRSSSGVIDMSACDRLEELECKYVTVRHMYINPCTLISCTLENMSEFPVVKDVLTALASGAPRLQTLTVRPCGCPELLPELFPTLTCLKKVGLASVDIGDSELHFPPSVSVVRLLVDTMPLSSLTCLVDRFVAMPQSVMCQLVLRGETEAEKLCREVNEYVTAHSWCGSVLGMVESGFTTNSPRML